MTPLDQDRITQYLRRWSDGSDEALEEMLPHVYAELRKIASRYRRRERGGTLQTTEIINEAYLRLSAQNGIDWKDRSHFFAVAARIMRHMLVDRARAKLYGKRGGGSDHISLDDIAAVTPEPDVSVIDLNDSLERLAKIDERKARIVELQNSGNRLLYGVAERKNYTLDQVIKAFDEGTPEDVVAKPRRGTLPFKSLTVAGREYSNWLMNPTILLPKLVEDLKEKQVAFVQRQFETPADVAALKERVVINCTGLGAKTLFSDDKVIPQRGHLVVLQKTDPKQFYFFSGGCSNRVTSYAFCRQDDVVLGGSVQAGNDSLTIGEADDAIFKRILSNSRLLFGGKPRACVWE